MTEIGYALVYDPGIPYTAREDPNPQLISGDLRKHQGYEYLALRYVIWYESDLPPELHDIILAKSAPEICEYSDKEGKS